MKLKLLIICILSMTHHAEALKIKDDTHQEANPTAYLDQQIQKNESEIQYLKFLKQLYLERSEKVEGTNKKDTGTETKTTTPGGTETPKEEKE